MNLMISVGLGVTVDNKSRHFLSPISKPVNLTVVETHNVSPESSSPNGDTAFASYVYWLEFNCRI